MTVSITGVHPYAEKFPIPAMGEVAEGSALNRDGDPVVVTITRIEAEHCTVSCVAGSWGTSFNKPVPNDFVARVASRIMAGAINADALSWTNRPATAPSPTRATAGFVYFIADEDGYIKIGHASSVPSRIASLQTATRHHLRLIGFIPGTLADERALHAKFASSHVRGEWFAPTPALDSYLDGIAQ